MIPLAVFGIHSGGANLAVELLLLFLLVVYFALIYWTYADARRRISDPMLIGCATAASCFPFVGTVVYMIVRPPEYLEDVRERELEMQAAEARLAELGYHLCPHCDYEVERDFLRCPNCMRKLKDPCQSCGKPLDPNWRVCPYCEAEVGGMTQAPRRSRRRREAGAEQPVGSGGAYAERGAAAPAAAERGGAPGAGSGERRGTSSGFGDRAGTSGPGGRGGAGSFGGRSGSSDAGLGEPAGTPVSGLAARDGASASTRRGQATT